jgi:hypothetical protein
VKNKFPIFHTLTFYLILIIGVIVASYCTSKQGNVLGIIIISITAIILGIFHILFAGPIACYRVDNKMKSKIWSKFYHKMTREDYIKIEKNRIILISIGMIIVWVIISSLVIIEGR